MNRDLFERKEGAPQGVPLADRLRPRILDEIVGQDEAVGPGSFLRLAIERDAIPSLVLWGPPGSGKTTLLEDLAQRLESRGQTTWLFRLHTGDRLFPREQFECIRKLPESTVVMLDGAEQLGVLPWRRFSRFFRRTGRPLIVTIHSPGRWPTWVSSKSDVRILDQIVARLLPESELATAQINRRLFDKHRGNLRDALREWYDLVGQLEDIEFRTKNIEC